MWIDLARAGQTQALCGRRFGADGVPAERSATSTTPMRRAQTENTPAETETSVFTSAEPRPPDSKREVTAPPRDGRPAANMGERDSTSRPEEREPTDMPDAHPDVVISLPDHP